MGNGEEVKRMPLTFLDPDFFVKSKSENPTAGAGGLVELEGEYICVVCCGVVLDPVECK
jgi:hypothetical protein